MENITKTFNSVKYECLAYNRNTKATESKSVILNKDFDNDSALKIISKKFNSPDVIYMDITNKHTIQEKRSMEVTTFMQYAKQIEKANPALITRTVKNTVYTVVVYDRVQKITDTANFSLNKSFDDDATTLKALQKRYNGDTLLVVDVLGKNTTETLYGITPEDFIKHSKVVEDSKEG